MLNKFFIAICAIVTLLFSNVINAAPRYYNIERKPSIEVNLDALEKLKLDAPNEIFIPYEEELPEAKSEKKKSAKKNEVKKKKAIKKPLKKKSQSTTKKPKKIAPKEVTIWPNEVKKSEADAKKKKNSVKKQEHKTENEVKENLSPNLKENDLQPKPSVIVMPEPTKVDKNQEPKAKEPKIEKPKVTKPQAEEKISKPQDGLLPPGIVTNDQGKLKDYDQEMDSIRLFEIDEKIKEKQSQDSKQNQSLMPKSQDVDQKNDEIQNSQSKKINLPKFDDSPKDVTESIFDENLPAELPEPKFEEKAPVKESQPIQQEEPVQKEPVVKDNKKDVTPLPSIKQPAQEQSPMKDSDKDDLPKLPFLNDLSEQKNFSSLKKKPKFSDEKSVQSTELVSLGSRFFFDFDRKSSKLKTPHKSELDKIADALINTDGTKISIVGFAKNSKDYSDRRIALQRVIAIRKYMIDKGIDASRLHIKSITPDAKIADNSSNVEIIFTDLISDFKH